MYKYYLGAFGNRSYIRPQYEILDDGSIKEVGENRWEDFANGGTVSLAFSTYSDSEKEVESIQNRLVKFKIDRSKDLHPNFDIYNDNSNKYQIHMDSIVELEREEVIEILPLECTIEDFLNDKTKRKFKLNHKPNQLVILKTGYECYGPFECISTFEEPFYNVTAFINDETVNKYKYSDIERFVYDATFSIRRSDQMKFIFNLDKLNDVDPVEQIEYFDNEELADFLRRILEKSEAIENIAEMRETFLNIVDSFSDEEEMKLSEKKINRICHLLQMDVELSDCKVKIAEEYFRNSEYSEVDMENYLKNHEELFEDRIRNDLLYDEKKAVFETELLGLENQKVDLQIEIENSEKKLNDQKNELKKLEEQAIITKQEELDNLVANTQKELDTLNEEIQKAKIEKSELVTATDVYRRDVSNLKSEHANLTSDINAKIAQWAAENRNSEIIRLLVTEMELPEPESSEKDILGLNNIAINKNQDQIISIVSKKLSEASRNVSKDEVYNYLISIVQNYMTVFAGEPGTGKTSMCKLLAKALGLYETRFAEIPVERGWTSSKDLIGYYNPLTKELEKTQPAFSDCMIRLNEENKKQIVEAPYFVLLDEANLSPIEFYWSHFNYFCDNPDNQIVEYANGDKYCFGRELKFLATINYDQTTSDLSPRFLDRAWVISMNPVSVDSIIGALSDETTVSNNEEIISFENLESIFGWKNYSDKKMNQITKSRIDLVVGKMKEGGHIISARSLKAVTRYYLVAEEFMSSKETALDYAISQKFLPMISGNGKHYGEFLNSLLTICKENQLTKSASIIVKILERAQHDFYSYFSV